MNPAELVLLGVTFVGSVVAFSFYLARTADDRRRRRRQKLGAKNARRQMHALTEEVCVICGHQVEAETDIFDEKTNTWWHQACWRQSVK